MRTLTTRLFFAAVLLLAGRSLAVAEVTTERSASILVWPKIISDGTRDTVLQLTNTSNSLVRAHCFYVNAALTDPELPEGPLNPRLWQEIDFDVRLTRQQPTFWLASEGRNVNPTDPPCSQSNNQCFYAGFDPGLVPPVAIGFTGELKCVQVDDSGAPLSGNNLIGDARLIGVGGTELTDGSLIFASDIASYNAIGILGRENNGDGTLVLGGGQCGGSGAICGSDEDCGDQGPCVLEYDACPQTWILNHNAEGSPDQIFEEHQIGDAPTSISTELTIVPCTQNFETQKPTSVTIQFLTWNEFESQFSVSTTITCWANFRMDALGSLALTFEGQLPDKLGSVYLQTRMRAADATPFGLMMVAEQFHVAKPSMIPFEDDGPLFTVTFIASAASNLHVEGERTVPDIISIPAEQVAP